ncbi:DNA starvation/stationary phase protection protein Dps [Entomobacter blattae]|uniref:DNA protection during starvation protein n=1 Tax=Entomobacter blattae TaxID=2762277 RepID=A0A7H1NQA5_9PROT|nr:DNA starvation/stationary phase protection protein Dps [Entomobacter blattae]QNT77965.1 DNA protection during starvation protein [Entomobacter blattae]
MTTKPSLRSTRNSLPSNTKTVSIQLLNARLADGIDLALTIKQAHWNIKGSSFYGVHTMLDTFRGELDNFNDTMAERVAALGGIALGTVPDVSKSKLPTYPTNVLKIPDHVHALIERYAAFTQSIRENIDAADEAGDMDTADIFTEISRGIEKQLWFLESLVYDEK